MDMFELQVAIGNWAAAVFPDRNPMGAINKLVLEEIPELAKELPNPHGDHADELADCFILLLDIAEQLGIDAGNATFRKLEENRARNWKYNPTTGFYKHT